MTVCSGNTQLAEPLWTPSNDQQENKHKRLHGLHWTAMQRRHFADCLATGFAVVSTASTESFSSMRLGFLMIFDSRLHMRAASGNVTFITTRSCRMMLNDRKHPRTPSQNGVTEGECKLCILLGHLDNEWNYHLYPRHNDTYTMTKRPYKDVTTGYYIMALKKTGHP